MCLRERKVGTQSQVLAPATHCRITMSQQLGELPYTTPSHTALAGQPWEEKTGLYKEGILYRADIKQEGKRSHHL